MKPRAMRGLVLLAALGVAGWSGCREPWSSASLHPHRYARIQFESFTVDGRAFEVHEAGPLSYRIDLPDYSIFLTPRVKGWRTVDFHFEAPTEAPLDVTDFAMQQSRDGGVDAGRISSWFGGLERAGEHGWPARPSLRASALFPPGKPGESYTGSFTLVQRDASDLRVLNTHRIVFRAVPGEERYGVPDYGINWWDGWAVKLRNGTLFW